MGNWVELLCLFQREMALIATKCLSAVDELDSKLSLEEPSTVLDALSSGKAQSKDIIFTKCSSAPKEP